MSARVFLAHMTSFCSPPPCKILRRWRCESRATARPAVPGVCLIEPMVTSVVSRVEVADEPRRQNPAISAGSKSQEQKTNLKIYFFTSIDPLRLCSCQLCCSAMTFFRQCPWYLWLDGQTILRQHLDESFKYQTAALSIAAKATHAAYGANKNADRASRSHDSAMNARIVASKAKITNNAASGRSTRIDTKETS